MAKTIELGAGLKVDAAEIATEVVAALGARGSGKSNVLAVIAEGLLRHRIQVIVLDYVGIWFSLRLAPDGKTASPFSIPVIGGRHGDIPLAPAGGRLVAESLAASGSPAVIDVSSFTKGDRCRFAADFAEALFHAKKEHTGPCFLVLEEAQRFAPQKILSGMEYLGRMLGAFEEIAEVGRNYGLGLGLLSQRPQKINKDVLNLADTVFGFRANGVGERKAVAEWVQEKGAAGREEVAGELPGLPKGTALVWSPVRGIYGRYALHKKSTYDAGATPLTARAAVKTRPLDLGELEASMAAVVEQAKASDPKALRAEIARLKQTPVATHPSKAVEREMANLRQALANEIAEVRRLRGIDAAASAFVQALAKAKAGKQVELVADAPVVVPSKLTGDVLRTHLAGEIARHHQHLPGQIHPLGPRANRAPRPEAGGDLAKGERAVLTAVAQHDGGVTREQLTVLTGYKRSSRDTYLQRLGAKCFVEQNGERILATPGGMTALGDDFEPLPTGVRLREHHLATLPEGERKVLEVAIKFWPGVVHRDLISEVTEYRRSSRDTYLQRLGARQLVTTSGGGVRASDLLFDEIDA